MPPRLGTGTILKGLYSGRPIRVTQFHDEGGQGEVYQAEWGGDRCALKWYKPEYVKVDSSLLDRLKRLVVKGSPSDKFLWPDDVVFKKDSDSKSSSDFGYVMPWRDGRFAQMRQYLKGEVKPSFEVLCMAGLSFAGNFLKLHAEGLCYCDINRGNLFFDPDTGDVRICDNDNVDVDGQAGGILGTGPFMAPEIHRREATPSILTDLYSLSVILFEMFMIHHPLYGRRVGKNGYSNVQQESLQLLGTEPLFIFDPHNRDNAPDPVLDPNPLAFWPVYPEFLRALFVRAFTDGLSDPHARVRDREWQRELARLRDCIFVCPNCEVEVFYDVARLKDAGSLIPCWNCGCVPPPPARMRVNGHIVMLGPGAELYPHHVDLASLYDYSRVIAKVSSDGQHLTNLSGDTWTVFTASGSSVSIRDQDTIALGDCTRISFGKSDGEVKQGEMKYGEVKYGEAKHGEAKP